MTLAGSTQALRSAWAARDVRERRLLLLAAVVLALFLLWSLVLQPALRTLRTAPAQIDHLDTQLQAMRAMAGDVQRLRAIPPLPREQAAAALRAASERLGTQARLSEQGERAVLTLTGATPGQVRDWLTEARGAARARPLEVNLTRDAQGLSGTVVVTLGTP